MALNNVDSLLDPLPLQLETGWERLGNGVLHVAVRTDMRRCRRDARVVVPLAV